MARQRYFLILICIIVGMTAGPARACDGCPLALGFGGVMMAGGVPKPWKLMIKAGQADAAVVTESGAPVLHIRCRESSFSLVRELAIASHDYPYITWTWKATRLPPSGDVRKRGCDDQALQLLVAFENRRVLSYIWDSNAPEGFTADQSIGWPVNIMIKVIVVDSGAADAGKWLTHTRNIYADYRKYFNEDPARIIGIRIQSNTQHTGDFAEGFVKGVIFAKSLQDAAL